MWRLVRDTYEVLQVRYALSAPFQRTGIACSSTIKNKNNNIKF